MIEQNKTTENVTSMDSDESGIASSTRYEYWLNKINGKIYLCKIDSTGDKSWSDPLDKDSVTKEPSSFTYTDKPEIHEHITNFVSITYTEAVNKLSS